MTADVRTRRPGTRTGVKRAPTSGGKRRPETSVPVADEQVVDAVTLPEAPGARIAVFEPAPTHRVRARDAVTALGFELVSGDDLEAARAALLGAAAPDVLLVGVPGGEDLIEAALALDRQRPVLVAALAGSILDARARAVAAGCDLFTLRPHSAESLGAPLAAASALAVLRQRVVGLEGNQAVLRERLARHGETESATGFQHIDFFKQILLIELKRARRFGYSLAVCLVAVDPAAPGAAPLPHHVAAELRNRVAAAIVQSVRDIDFPVELSPERVLAFLPHTDLAGAGPVGRRIADAVHATGVVADGGKEHRVTVSVGIAALREGQPPSLARVMRDAAAAVRAAQLKGGDCVEVRK